ncbi:MAG: serine hydrolase, partial [Myxococcales bacterium]|nr:serine hydrolase [Myxococcales bacterium]
EGCTHVKATCDDLDLCTDDWCDDDSGCKHDPIVCNDQTVCTTDSCSPIEGCVYSKISCDDQNACTNDGCDVVKGCAYSILSCNDNNACTTDSCNPTTGCVHTTIVCDDTNECTDDACNATTGCTYTTISCNDGKPCTQDSCNVSSGCVNTLINCSDGNPCTADSCDKAGLCTHTSGGCNDNNACTVDSCLFGNCFNANVDCNDDNPCTIDSCNAKVGCLHTPKNCDDGNVCTNDACAQVFGGLCIYSPKDCNDNNPCTTDGCLSLAGGGCFNVNDDNGTCTDGNPCTIDVCRGGVCRLSQDDKRAQLKFESSSNGKTPDSSGSQNDGLLEGNAAITFGGKVGLYSVSFPGNDATSAVRIPSAGIPGKNFTFAAWVKPSIAGARYFVGRTSAVHNNGLVMGVNGHLILHGTEFVNGLPVLPVGTWTHILITYNGTEARIYQNGLPSRLHKKTANTTWTSDLWLGQELDCENGCTSASQSFGGNLDEVLWFEKALTPHQVANLWAGQSTLCSDGKFCTTDACSTGGGCTHASSNFLCNDGNPCTSDTCNSQGVCTYTRTDYPCSSDELSSTLYGGIWSNKPGKSDVYWSMTEAQFIDKWSTVSSTSNMRLTDIEITTNSGNGQNVFHSLFRPKTGNYALWIYTKQAFINQMTSYNQTTSLRLEDVETYVSDGTRYYIGSWTDQPGTGANQLSLELSWNQLTTDWNIKSGNGYRLVDLDVFVQNGTTLYNALYKPGSGGYALIGTSWDHFASTFEGYSGQMALVDVEFLNQNGELTVYGVWNGPDDFERTVGGWKYDQFITYDNKNEAEALNLVDIETRLGEPIAPVEVSAYLYDNLKPFAMGYSYAAGRYGSVVGYGGVGLARASWEVVSPNLPFDPGTRVHLASVSKTIMAMSYGVLVDRAGFDLDQKFWPWVADMYPNVDADVKQITFRQIMQHKAGFDGDTQYYDACADPLEDAVGALLADGPLEPVGQGNYTNSSTCINRVVLEHITGIPYVQWATTNVLSKAGVYDTTPTTLGPPTAAAYYANHLEYSTTSGIEPNLSVYFEPTYAPVVAAWGWYSNARDMLKYLMGLRNGLVVDTDVLDNLFTTEAGFFDITTNVGTGYWHNGGWGSTYYPNNKKHTAGVSTVIMHLPEETDLVILINTLKNSALDQGAGAFNAWFEDDGPNIIQVPPGVDLIFP